MSGPTVFPKTLTFGRWEGVLSSWQRSRIPSFLFPIPRQEGYFLRFQSRLIVSNVIGTPAPGKQQYFEVIHWMWKEDIEVREVYSNSIFKPLFSVISCEEIIYKISIINNNNDKEFDPLLSLGVRQFANHSKCISSVNA